MYAEPRTAILDHEATLEELAALARGAVSTKSLTTTDFDDIQVICKRGDEEIPIAKPSRASYIRDRSLEQGSESG